MSFALRARGLRAATRSLGVVSPRATRRLPADPPQKPLRSNLPQVRYVQIDADKSSPMHDLPASGSEPVCL